VERGSVWIKGFYTSIDCVDTFMPESIVDVLQKATGDGIFIVQKGSITAVNNATIKLLGFS